MDDELEPSTVSIISMVEAIGGIAASLMGHPYWGLFICLIAILFSGLGLIMAAPPMFREDP